MFHQTHRRRDRHLFITVIAYQLVQTIRRLGERGQGASWSSLRAILEDRQRVTAAFHREDGRALHERKAFRPEPRLRSDYDALDSGSRKHQQDDR